MIKKIKEKHLDSQFSKLVRLRANYQCEAQIVRTCDGVSGQMQCSHLMSRRFRSTRFAPHNACSHCASCHRYLGGNPLVFAEWIIGHMGREASDDLRREALIVRKRSQPQMRDLYNEMKEILQEMEKARALGDEGRLDFTLEN